LGGAGGKELVLSPGKTKEIEEKKRERERLTHCENPEKKRLDETTARVQKKKGLKPWKTFANNKSARPTGT